MKRIPSLLFSLMAALAAPPLYAHTKLAESLPADGAVVDEAPEALRLGFSGEVELLQAAVKNAEGETVNPGFTAPAATGREFTVELPDLEDGRYTVEWTAVGTDDGHTILGDYSFSVR